MSERVNERVSKRGLVEQELVDFSTEGSLFRSGLASRFTRSLVDRKITSVLVEGGAALLTSLLKAGLWDEMRVFRSPKLLGDGVKAPAVQGKISSRELIGDDELTIYKPA